MKNKKALGTFSIIAAAIVSGILLFIFVGPIIKGILLDQQIAYASSKTEEITVDCDEDGFVISDQCPCNPEPDKTKLKSGETCGDPYSKATDNCPKLCKT